MLRRSRVQVLLRVGLTALVAAPLTGCWSITPRESSSALATGAAPPTAPAAVTWPARDAQRAREALASTPAALDLPSSVSVIEPAGARSTSHSQAPAAPVPAPPAPLAPTAHATQHPDDASRANPLADFAITAQHRGEGLVRVIDAKVLNVEFADGPDGVRANVTRTTADTMYRFVSYSTLPNRPATLSELAPLVVMRAGQAAREVAAERRNRPADAAGTRGSDVLWEGLAMHLRRPAPATPRGLIVHLGGSNTGELEGRFLDVLIARGWAVLSMPFVGIPGGESTGYVIQTRGRTPPDLSVVVPSPSTKPFLNPLGDAARMVINLPATAEVFASPADFGTRVAAITDDRLAEVAYAVEAILAHVEEADPALARLPRVLIGCSAGAMAAPAVAARLPGRFAACVLVGGGANLLDVALRTSFIEARPRIRWATDRDESDQRREAVEAYLSRVALDPVRTAPALRGTRTLVIHAAFDAIVPSARGLDLWEALGRPERWNFAGGHLGLFVLLPEQAEPVHQWLIENVPPATP